MRLSISRHLWAFASVAFVGTSFLVMATAAEPTIPGEPRTDGADIGFFESRIRPVLTDKCYKCHSSEANKSKGGLLLDTREGIRQGGDTGHAVVPGNLDESVLIQALRWHDKDLRMPPEKEGGKLSDAVIADFERWIKMGAPDPREGAAKAATKAMSLEEGRKFWAFRPPVMPEVPAVKDMRWPWSDVDRFTLAALEAKGLSPVADASKGTLLRRVYFDLIGLPPSPEEIQTFLKDTSRDAFENVVDRLLASPQFGERWGRHWLDVARYAESTGKERNFTFPTAWRYRDYVIAAFNADKPYDQFIREQIAGDLLPTSDPSERNQNLIATGFLAIGPKGLNEKNREQFRMDLIDEQIDATSRAVLGVTVACARCHDHKFDPIPQREYYALAGIFRSTATHFGTESTNQKNRNGTPLLALATVPIPQSESAPSPVPPTEQGNARVAAVLANNPRRAKKFAALSPERKAAVTQRILAQGGDSAPATAGKKGKYGPARTASAGKAMEQAMGVSDATPANARIYIRGEVDSPGEAVPRGFVTVLTNGPSPTLPANASGRLELANWLASPGNPLTARVMVNRVWQHLFGQGLVRTADNFGATGDKPSHPELLDALAVQFMTDGWSVKKLIRSLILSRTYQLSSALDEKNFAIDPDDTLLWRSAPRRLDAEAIRDAMLGASGQLEKQPPRGSVVANVGDGYVGRNLRPEMFTNVRANYRSIYLPIVRDFVPDALDVFDFAEPSLVVAARDVTNVPAQALYLMNSAFVREQAAALAKRILNTPATYPERITLAYQLTLSRKPTEAERSRADKYLLNEARALIPVKGGNTDDAAHLSWTTFCQALFACAEFRNLN